MERKTIELELTIHPARSFITRLRGLMFRKRPLVNEGLWIIPCNAIHMFFMSFPIDVIMLNRDRQVVKTINNLKPWKIAPPVKDAHSVLELPVGAIRHYDIQLGDTVTFRCYPSNMSRVSSSGSTCFPSL